MKTAAEDSKVNNSSNSVTGEFAKSTGSAGYYFYQNVDGYYFNSIDRLNSIDKNPPVEILKAEIRMLSLVHQSNKDFKH